VRVARHPVAFSPITVPEYRKLYGPSHEGKTKLDRPAATCPACHQPLLIRGETGPQDRHTFAHFAPSVNTPDVFCPIKLAGKHKYSVLCPVGHDPVRAQKLRESFFVNWKVHWNRFKDLVGYVDVGDFIDVLKVADKANVWGYRAIQEHEVIITLMLISDFKPVTAARPVKSESQPDNSHSENSQAQSPQPQPQPQSPPGSWRKHWVRFWFESRAESFEDFWNLSLKNKVIIRVEFDVPVGETRLKPDYLHSFKVVDVSVDYLANRKSGDDVVVPMVEKRMKGAFKKYLK